MKKKKLHRLLLLKKIKLLLKDLQENQVERRVQELVKRVKKENLLLKEKVRERKKKRKNLKRNSPAIRLRLRPLRAIPPRLLLVPRQARTT